MTGWLRKRSRATIAIGSPARYLVVGAANTAFALSVYWLLLYAGVQYQWASAASLVLAIVLGFKAHGRVVFHVKGSFVRYVLAWTGIYFVSIALIAAIRNDVGDYVAGVSLLPVSTLLSFVLMKRFVFAGSPTSGMK
jgi:putative flippase GtrA